MKTQYMTWNVTFMLWRSLWIFYAHIYATIMNIFTLHINISDFSQYSSILKYVFLSNIIFKSKLHKWFSKRTYIFDYTKILAVCVGNYNLTNYLLIEFIIPNLSQIYFCIPKSLKQFVQTGFWVQNHLSNQCSWVVNSQRLFCSQIVCIKAFWYTK